MIKSYPMKHLKIDIGAGDPRDGESSPEGYLKQDVDGNIPGLDIVCNFTDLLTKCGAGSCAALRASHVLEHFGIHEQEKNFKMLFDLLEEGGTLEIIVPNFYWHSQLVLEGQDAQAVYYAFGGQLDEWDFHKYGFTPNLLRGHLEKAGFKDIQIIPNSSIECTAKK